MSATRTADDQRLTAAIKGDRTLRKQLLSELGPAGVEHELHRRQRDAKHYRSWMQASVVSGEMHPREQAARLKAQRSFLALVQQWLDEVQPLVSAQRHQSYRDRLVREVLAAVAEVLKTEREMEIARVELDRLMQPDAHAASRHRGTALRRHVPRGDAP